MRKFIYSKTNSVSKASKDVEDKTKEVFLPLTLKKDKYKSLIEMVSDYDYPIEKHFYETKDKYINAVFRISGPRGTTAQANKLLGERKPVVIYQHGLLDSCASVCCCALDSMAFFFAEKGFDVWMNNSRGNRFSRHHAYMDPGVH